MKIKSRMEQSKIFKLKTLEHFILFLILFFKIFNYFQLQLMIWRRSVFPGEHPREGMLQNALYH